ncbi:SCF ubiquitin ligase complex subunit [Malassezia vespertilionis]|uniref:Grr1p n=1 Tax=Malassezia vespertilionis TaxID=2020962 RepID=A0A2N1JGD7_9BASI|nr:SCF ubiquitin ligase complex subunit [Malassezia vespertilionis]PKI85598.1 Grr1p [Malassezia vespertilionis]WFD04952.1 SCF ubiquitin ligase complex subunit [Malassezia vespertilionis]
MAAPFGGSMDISTPRLSPGRRSSTSSSSDVFIDDYFALPGSDDDMDMAPKSRDVFARSATYGDLPHEILLQIFHYVHTSQQDLQSCLLVCKQWCACGVQLLWYRPAFHKISSLFKLIHIMIQPDTMFPYATYIRRLNFSLLAGALDDQLLGRMEMCHRVERLTLAGCVQVTDATLARVLQNIPQLVAIDLNGVVQLTDATLSVLAERCPRLQGANLTGCRHVTTHGIVNMALQCRALRRIKAGHCPLVDGWAFTQLLRHCPILLEADFVHCTQIDDGAVREVWLYPNLLREIKLAYNNRLTDHAFPTHALALDLEELRNEGKASTLLPLLQDPIQFQVCEHLRILDLTGSTQITDEAVRGIVAHAPKLRNISLAKCTRLTDESVYAIARLGRNIHYLHLAHVANLTDRAMLHLAEHCTRIRYLDLACCVLLTDASVIKLAANLPKLRRIGLVRVQNLTDRGVYSLVERHTNLERIHLSYCDKISVPTIFWLTQRLGRLTHLSLTGVPAFRNRELQSMCRAPPGEFSEHQRASFCVYSGRGVNELRRFLLRVFMDESLAEQYGTLDPDIRAAFQSSLARYIAQQKV